MVIVKTTDVWTERYPNYYECLKGAFIDGFAENYIPYDRYKIVLNCNCKITTNSKQIIIGNKHNAVVFYKGNNVVRIAVLCQKTDVLSSVNNSLKQMYMNEKLKDLFEDKNITQEIVDLKEIPKLNQFNDMLEMDVCSCDRMPLLKCMLKGDYTESKTNLGNYDSLEYDFVSNVEIVYSLKTDKEDFEIRHLGAFISKSKTRAIIIQSNGRIDLNQFIGN